MGLSPAEVRLRRLLASTPREGNPLKLLHNVAAMREQLVLLTRDRGHDDLPVIPASKAEEYGKQIDDLAERIEASAPPLDIWEALRSSEDGRKTSTPAIESKSRTELEAVDENEESSLLGRQGLSPTLRRRRFQREQKVDQGGGGAAKLDTATNQLVDKHRQIQDALIGEMAMFSEQMKNNSLLMEKSLQETARVLDSTEEAVEHSLSATNRANLRAGFISKSSWKTACFTWLTLFLMCLVFIFMIGVIRMTR